MVDPKDPQNSIFNGDYVVIDPQVVPYDGDIVLARISEEYSTIKRMYIKGDYVYLVPDNPKCKALKKKKTEIKIVGKIVDFFRPPIRKEMRIKPF